MSSDRERRARLEWVQTRLKELEPEVSLTESPGHSERLAELQAAVGRARRAGKEAEERNGWAQTELVTLRRDIEQMNLAVQAEQAQTVPEALGLTLILLAGVVIFFGMIAVAVSPELRTGAVGWFGVACGFGLGVVLRARASRPRKPS